MTAQVENGYTRIANELYDVILTLPLGGYEQRVMHTIIRKTYGFNKKEDYIALSQIEEATHIARTHVSRTVKALIGMGIVTKNGNKIGINKDTLAWKVTKKEKGGKLPKMVMAVTKIGNKKLPNTALQKTIKDNITKDKVSKDTTARQYGNPDINELIEFMKTTLHLPVLDKSVNDNRRYAHLCIKKFGKENTLTAIRAASISKFWRGKVTSFVTLYYHAIAITQAPVGEVKGIDASKILSSSGKQEGDSSDRGGVQAIEAGIDFGNKPSLVL